MGIFDFLKKKKDMKIQGVIGYFNLEDWWLTDLLEEDRELIQNTYQPMGGGSLTDRELYSTSQTVVGLLSGLVGWFSKPNIRYMAYKIIKKAESSISADTKPLDIHFLYGAKIEISYKDRDALPNGLDIAVRACEQQISYSEKAAKEFLKRYKSSPLPSHKGYTQLAIVLEKQKNYGKAIQICEQAKSQGWAGDWNKRIEHCNKKQRV